MSPLLLMLALHAAPHDIDVTWRGVEGCEQAGFDDSLAAYLTGGTRQRTVAVTVAVERVGATQWAATLELATDGAPSTRRLTGASCSELSSAAAFITAVLVDPGTLGRAEPGAPAGPTPWVPESTTTIVPPPIVPVSVPQPTAPVPVPTPQPTASDSRTPAAIPDAEPAPMPSQPAPSQPRTRALVGFVRIAGGFEALALPKIGAQLSGAGGLLGRRWRAELTAAYRAPTTAYAATDPTAGARVRLWTVGARGCGVLRPARIEVALCGALEAGQVLGAGVGFTGGRSDRFAWLAGALGPAVAWAPRRWLALWLGVELAVPLLGGAFEARGLGTLSKIGPASLRAALGVEARFF